MSGNVRRDCYVYVLMRENGEPFYIGKGRNDRWTEHERWVKGGRSYKDNIIVKMQRAGLEIPKLKIAEGLTDAQALWLEVLIIESLKRRHEGGPLVNLTRGGDGLCDPTPEVRAKIAEATRRTLTGRKRPPEVVEKVRQAHLGKKRGPHADEHKASISAGMAAAWADPEKRAILSNAGMRGRKHSEETKAKMRERALGRVISESQRAAVSAAQKGRKASPETRTKMAEAQRRAWQARRELEKVDG
ncbi:MULTISPECIES: NUMOD3 domain-containing DNA-binding protein [unclassified Burkholderia]|uniref:NUMOD3 domain-containing DNA-binding protein n=1 Tax=unclassified Burkholderia TaxID=2613784 RepID=UPI000F566087|nr:MULTISPECIES: NUMOD3 domain-containing DNA-binding protein [unclassified Burkholderia]RQR87728.1 hypothetical protein DIE10_06485 [Burkholderia sp. Bp9011]RQR97071.1 hypothetical protein DIE09_06660 [Burkholderia sp. Bp9010]